MSIIDDFAGIAAHMKGDTWWKPAKTEPEQDPVLVELMKEPATLLPGRITYVDCINSAACGEGIKPFVVDQRLAEEIAFLNEMQERFEKAFLNYSGSAPMHPWLYSPWG